MIVAVIPLKLLAKLQFSTRFLLACTFACILVTIVLAPKLRYLFDGDSGPVVRIQQHPRVPAGHKLINIPTPFFSKSHRELKPGDFVDIFETSPVERAVARNVELYAINSDTKGTRIEKEGYKALIGAIVTEHEFDMLVAAEKNDLDVRIVVQQ